MPREKFHTLTEPMFYILLCLRQECCGMDVMSRITELTHGRVKVGPGTLYNLLEQFETAGIIRETRVDGRRSYLLTGKGQAMLDEEYQRICALAADYRCAVGKENDR